MFSILSERFSAFIMALTLFFLGLPYGNEPIKVDYTVKIQVNRFVPDPQYSSPLAHEYDYCNVSVSVENVGRPYKITNITDANIKFYRIVDGKKQYLQYSSVDTPEDVHDIIFKHGEVRLMGGRFDFDQGYDPGEYIVEVSVEHSDKIYTETITLT